MSRGIVARYGTPKASDFTYSKFRVPAPPPADTGADNTPGHLCWGQVGQVISPEVAATEGFEVVNNDETMVETTRESDKIKIENPDEPEDWVEVDRANKLYYNRTTNHYKKDSNTWSADPEGIGDFSPSPIEFSNFKPLGSTDRNRIRGIFTIKNGPTSA